jgi:hypothetical protein
MAASVDVLCVLRGQGFGEFNDADGTIVIAIKRIDDFFGVVLIDTEVGEQCVELNAAQLAITISVQKLESLSDRKSVMREKDFLESFQVTLTADDLADESQEHEILNLTRFSFFFSDLFILFVLAVSLSSFSSTFLIRFLSISFPARAFCLVLSFTFGFNILCFLDL